MPLFVLDPAFDGAGAVRRAFLAGCLAELRRSTNGALVVRRGDPQLVVPAVAGRRLVLTGSPYAVAPGGVVKNDGQPYAVFTPFARTWRAAGWPEPAPVPPVRWVHGVASEPLPEAPDVAADLPVAGEAAAHDRLDAFLSDDLAAYDGDRNRPDLDRTSHLSPYLRWGCIHPRQVLTHLGRGRADDRFRTELAWREFYADI